MKMTIVQMMIVIIHCQKNLLNYHSHLYKRVRIYDFIFENNIIDTERPDTPYHSPRPATVVPLSGEELIE